MEELARLLEARCPGRVSRGEPMSKPHDLFAWAGLRTSAFSPKREDEVALALSEARLLSSPAFVMGNGSNLVVRDGGIRGLVVILGEKFSKVEVRGTHVIAQSGATLSRVGGARAGERPFGLRVRLGHPGDDRRRRGDERGRLRRPDFRRLHIGARPEGGRDDHIRSFGHGDGLPLDPRVAGGEHRFYRWNSNSVRETRRRSAR